MTEQTTDRTTVSAPLSMFGPDFPFSYDHWLLHPDGLGQLPPQLYGTPVAIIGGGMSGLVAGYELMRLGLRPVVYEAEELGGRMRTVRFSEQIDAVAELGAMRFPPSATTLFHYIDLLGLTTKPFPNPLIETTPSTVININGETHRARVPADLPDVYQEVGDAWSKALEEGAELSAMSDAVRRRDAATVKAIWNRLVPTLDDESFYGFLAKSPAFASFRHREIFGQVGFGTGGQDVDFPNSTLEILRVVYTGADDHHRLVVGGCQQLPLRLWEHSPSTMAHWPEGTSLATLHADGFGPAVTRLARAGSGVEVTTADGSQVFPAAVFTPQVRLLLTRIECDESLLSVDTWTALERTHYVPSSKVFAVTDRPFWRDIDAGTGHPLLGMTLTDRMPRSTYLFDDGPHRPGVICLSYSWSDDSLKLAAVPERERLGVILRQLSKIYPDVDILSRVIADPITVTWENEPHFMGAFKINLPGHYRYQRRLYTHFLDTDRATRQSGMFLAGDDISWTGGFAEGAVSTALNAVWGVLGYLGGRTHASNPGPGDVFATIAPLDLPYL
jgi:monoamine oxidase